MGAHYARREVATSFSTKKKKNRLSKREKARFRTETAAANPTFNLVHRPKLFTAPPYPNIKAPVYPSDFFLVTRKVRFLRFCVDMDNKNPGMIIDRPTMVAFWEELTLDLYFEWKKSPRVAMMGSAEEWIGSAHKQSRPTTKQAALRMGNYWSKKLARVPELDVRNGPPMEYDVEKPRTRFRTKPGETVEQLKNAPRGRFNGQVYV